MVPMIKIEYVKANKPTNEGLGLLPALGITVYWVKTHWYNSMVVVCGYWHRFGFFLVFF